MSSFLSLMVFASLFYDFVLLCFIGLTSQVLAFFIIDRVRLLMRWFRFDALHVVAFPRRSHFNRWWCSFSYYVFSLCCASHCCFSILRTFYHWVCSFSYCLWLRFAVLHVVAFPRLRLAYWLMFVSLWYDFVLLCFTCLISQFSFFIIDVILVVLRCRLVVRHIASFPEFIVCHRWCSFSYCMCSFCCASSGCVPRFRLFYQGDVRLVTWWVRFVVLHMVAFPMFPPFL